MPEPTASAHMMLPAQELVSLSITVDVLIWPLSHIDDSGAVVSMCAASSGSTDATSSGVRKLSPSIRPRVASAAIMATRPEPVPISSTLEPGFRSRSEVIRATM